MTAHKRPATLSPEEALDDFLDDDSENEWLEYMKDPVKRCEFERNCIEDDIIEQKRVIILQDNPRSRSHCRFWNCTPRKLNGEPNIRSAFRFNFKDLSGRYSGKSSQSRINIS